MTPCRISDLLMHVRVHMEFVDLVGSDVLAKDVKGEETFLLTHEQTITPHGVPGEYSIMRIWVNNVVRKHSTHQLSYWVREIMLSVRPLVIVIVKLLLVRLLEVEIVYFNTVIVFLSFLTGTG